MSNSKSLNDILIKFQSLESELIENGGEISSDIEKKLSINDSDLSEKMNGYEKFVRYLKHQSEYLHSMEEHYVKRRKVIDNSIKRCKESMVNALKITGKNKLKTDEFNFSIGKSKKWNVIESDLDEELKDLLLSSGLAENKFKPHLNAIKDKYSEDDLPEWIEITENDFIRVS